MCAASPAPVNPLSSNRTPATSPQVYASPPAGTPPSATLPPQAPLNTQRSPKLPAGSRTTPLLPQHFSCRPCPQFCPLCSPFCPPQLATGRRHHHQVSPPRASHPSRLPRFHAVAARGCTRLTSLSNLLPSFPLCLRFPLAPSPLFRVPSVPLLASHPHLCLGAPPPS